MQTFTLVKGCALQPHKADPYYKDKIDESVTLVCRGHPCQGNYTFQQQSNKSVDQYETIAERRHRIKVTSPGMYRCWKNCNNGQTSPYCYWKVEGK